MAALICACLGAAVFCLNLSGAFLISIIFLTAKSQTKDVLDGFEHGGNDYLKKPFSMEELIVRIKALLDRIKLKKDYNQIIIGDYIFNYTKQILHYSKETVMLTERFL